MLDLLRMELAYIDKTTVTKENDDSIVSDSTLLFAEGSPQLSTLKSTGSTMFQVHEKDVDKSSPGESHRRIKNVQVELRGVQNSDGPFKAKLTMVNHSTSTDNRRPIRSRQSIILKSALTDSEKVWRSSGNLAPFQGCGMESTWKLSFPAAVKEIESKAIQQNAQKVLSFLKQF